jgi:hypothetical protein
MSATSSKIQKSTGTKRQPKPLTARTAASIAAGEWIRDKNGTRGTGVLEARGLTGGGIAYYFRTTTAAGKRERLPLGKNIGFKAAKQKYAELSTRYQSGEHNLRETLKAEQRERERQRQAADAAEQAAKEAEKARKNRTLGALLAAYTDQLQRDGKATAKNVRNCIEKNVHKSAPELWAKPLADTTADDLLAVVSVPANAGKLREAEKLRAYIRAAYSAGIKARHNAKALPALRQLRIVTNTAASLTPIEGANKAKNRNLSLAELRAYWHRIQAPEYAALRFHLLTGGQRITQLARATTADYDADAQSIRLWDTKGRRNEPRPHDVPVLPAARKAMRDMQSGIAGPYVFTATAGASGVDASSFSKHLTPVTTAMLEADELSERFTPGDVRRTVETRLAGAKVSKDTRAHLQSHGLHGIQTRHYDMYEYLPEKRAALETLHRLLTGDSADVVPMHRPA